MGCFIVPATEAIVTTIAEKSLKEDKVEIKKNLGTLNKMLWGGSALLAFEHVWHGEVVPFYPFLTAMESKDAAMTMLHEMSTVGVTMAVAVTTVWAVMMGVKKHFKKKDIELMAKVKVEEE